MHNSLSNLIEIKKEIQLKINEQKNFIRLPKIVAVTKTHPMTSILPLINYKHLDYGENKVQEAIEKWAEIKKDNKNIKLHLIGKLQTNKVKLAVKIFDYIHSLDNEKLANKISEEQVKQNKKLKMFIQVNIANEEQKSGIKKKYVLNFYNYCKKLNLDVIGTMCIPPNKKNSQNYFLEMIEINKNLNLLDLSIGMSDDYLEAAVSKGTFLRIGSKIFGQRN